MAKRFRDSELRNKAWYRELGARGRDLWNYLHDACDSAGIVDVDFKRIEFDLGAVYNNSDIDRVLNKKGVWLSEHRLFMPAFIEFQYGQLSEECKPHIPVIRSLNKRGIDWKQFQSEKQTVHAMRRRLSQKRKDAVIASDECRCTYCNASGEGVVLIVDHIIPLIKGGNNEDENLTTSCVSCNSRKSDQDAKDFIRKSGLSGSLSQSLIKKLDTLYKGLNTLEEKEKEKEKEKDKEKEARKSASTDELEACVKTWVGTCQHFGISKIVADHERTEIFRAMQRFGAEYVDLALFGARFEKPTEGFNPADHLSLGRIFGRNKSGVLQIEKFNNLGEKNRHRKTGRADGLMTLADLDALEAANG